MRSRIIIMLWLAGSCLLLLSCGNKVEQDPAEATDEGAAAVAVAQDLAPDFTLEGIDGNPVRLADSAGKVRLVDFWAVWCKPCVQELPMLQGLYDTYAADGYQMIGVYHSDEKPEQIQQFLEERGVRYPTGISTDELSEEFGGVFGLPAAFLIDGDGVILQRYQGEKSPAKLEQDIREALGLSVEPTT